MKIALVTGASRGIGDAIASSLSQDGWSILAPTRDELNLEDSSSVERYLLSCGVVDGLVLNAGINVPARLEDASDSLWKAAMNTNLEASFRVLRGVLPGMAERGFGRIVAISSIYANRAREGRGVYSSTKAGLEALIRVVCVEYGKRGILANVLAPGFVNTELTLQNNSQSSIDQLLERVPLGRLAEPAEVALAAKFLLSPSNTYVSGQVLAIDGGWSCT